MEALQFLTPFVKGNNIRNEEVYGTIETRIDEVYSNSNQDFDHIEDNQSEASLSSEDLSFFETKSEKDSAPVPKETPEMEKRNKRKLSTFSWGDDHQRPEVKKSKYEDESRKMFLLSLLADVQKLSDHKMRLFRRSVLEVLDSLFAEQENRFSSEQIASDIIIPKAEPLAIEWNVWLAKYNVELYKIDGEVLY